MDKIDNASSFTVHTVLLLDSPINPKILSLEQKITSEAKFKRDKSVDSDCKNGF